MNWDAVGAVAELVGALAVVATLAYLAVQVRQNSNLIEQNSGHINASIAAATRDAQNELSRILASDPAAADVFWRGLDGRSSLADPERRQFDAMLHMTFSATQQLIDSSTEETLAATTWIFGFDGARDWWAEYASVFSPSYQERVNQILEKNRPAV